MFLTKDDLKLSYGVDLTIGAAFVDRAVPKDNLYWKNRTIYLPGAPGYIFMPIYADLLYRCGADLSELTSEINFQNCEGILHSAALHEHEKISWKEHIQQVIDFIKPRVTRQTQFEKLTEYLLQEHPVKKLNTSLGTVFPSLNRADSYLFSLTAMISPKLNVEKAIEGWYGLMTYFLLMDDLADIKDDLKTGQENALLDAGLNDAGEKIIYNMIDASILALDSINPVMANRMDHKKSLIDIHGIIESIRLEK